MKKYCSYENLINEINTINSGDIVYIISDILRLAKITNSNGESFDRNKIIDSILNKVGTEGTVLIPTFNWDFCQGIMFDYAKSPSQTGALGNAALKRDDFIRTRHPIYSFSVCGKDADKLGKINPRNSFGKGTVFDYMQKNNAKALVIDFSPMMGFTFCHHVEQMYGVPFRYHKNFTADYKNQKGEISCETYSMYVRDLSINPKPQMYLLDDILTKLNIVKTTVINDIPIHVFGVNDAASVIELDIKCNKAKNLYDY